MEPASHDFFQLKTISILSAALFLFASQGSAHAYDVIDLSSKPPVMRLSDDLDYLTAPIKSKKDLAEYVRGTSMQKSPLNLLPRLARERFLKSLTFNESGISGFDYFQLESNLTVSQVYQVLSLFGVQRTVAHFTNARVETDLDQQILDANSAKTCTEKATDCGSSDHKNYECLRRATCTSSYNQICLASC